MTDWKTAARETRTARAHPIISTCARSRCGRSCKSRRPASQSASHLARGARLALARPTRGSAGFTWQPDSDHRARALIKQTSPDESDLGRPRDDRRRRRERDDEFGGRRRDARVTPAKGRDVNADSICGSVGGRKLHFSFARSLAGFRATGRAGILCSRRDALDCVGAKLAPVADVRAASAS